MRVIFPSLLTYADIAGLPGFFLPIGWCPALIARACEIPGYVGARGLQTADS